MPHFWQERCGAEQYLLQRNTWILDQFALITNLPSGDPRSSFLRTVAFPHVSEFASVPRVLHHSVSHQRLTVTAPSCCGFGIAPRCTATQKHALNSKFLEERGEYWRLKVYVLALTKLLLQDMVRLKKSFDRETKYRGAYAVCRDICSFYNKDFVLFI